MENGEPLHLTHPEARGLMLAAQGLFHDLPTPATIDDVYSMIDRLGVVQIDTISVVDRSQYLVLWSRLGSYDRTLLDRLLYPERTVFEYWSHAASIVPMSDYHYYRPKMLQHADHMWKGDREWLAVNPKAVQETLETIRSRGPLASVDFERPPDARQTGPWDWHGPKESRRALEVLWTMGEIMVHSRRAGQKVYDSRERVLADAFGTDVPDDTSLPDPGERLRYFGSRTVRALGVTIPSWIADYFRLPVPRSGGTRKTAMATLLAGLQNDGEVVPAMIEGIPEPAYVSRAILPFLDRLRDGETPTRTTLLSPFDSLIWDRARARMLFDYEVCFEAYVPPHKRRYGYYCLAILHRGNIVGRVDSKADRTARQLLVRAVHLEEGVSATDDLLDGLANALKSLATFLGLNEILVERSELAVLAPALMERVQI